MGFNSAFKGLKSRAGENFDNYQDAHYVHM